MNTQLKIGVYIDDEERELVEAIESDDYVFGENQLTQERVDELRQAARNTLTEERQKISLHVPRKDLPRFLNRKI